MEFVKRVLNDAVTFPAGPRDAAADSGSAERALELSSHPVLPHA